MQQDRALFHVRGSSPLNTVAVGVEAAAGSLNSEDCFVLVTPSEVHGHCPTSSSTSILTSPHRAARPSSMTIGDLLEWTRLDTQRAVLRSQRGDDAGRHLQGLLRPLGQRHPRGVRNGSLLERAGRQD